MSNLPASYPGEASGVSRSSESLAPAVEAARERPAPGVAGKRPSPSGLRWALLALAATIAAIMLWPVLAGEPQTEATAPAMETAPTVAGDTATIAETTPEPERAEAAGDAASETAAAREPAPAVPSVRPARLTVVVFPWGEVWINGKQRGAAPLKDVSLKPGRYKISAGQGKPLKTQTIRLREAQRKTVQFDLTK